MPVLLELIGMLAVVGAAGTMLWRLARGPREPSAAAPSHGAWAPHVAVVDNDTVVTVRRGGETLEALEIARIAHDDPEWHAKLLDARAEAALRASALNTPD